MPQGAGGRAAAGSPVSAGARGRRSGQPCGLPWDLRMGMTLAETVRHLNLRRIPILHLRDNTIAFRPPRLHGFRFAEGRIFFGEPRGGTARGWPGPAVGRRGRRRAAAWGRPRRRAPKAAGLSGVTLLSRPERSRVAARPIFAAAGAALHRGWQELAWRVFRPSGRPSELPPGVFARWIWYCHTAPRAGPGGRSAAPGGAGQGAGSAGRRLRAWLEYGRRHDAFLAVRPGRQAPTDGGASYWVWLHVRPAGPDVPARPKPQVRFTAAPAPPGGPAAAAQRLRGRRFQDVWGVHEMTLLPNGRVVIVGGPQPGGPGAVAEIAGRWALLAAPTRGSGPGSGLPSGLALRLDLTVDRFYVRHQRYAVGHCVPLWEPDGAPRPCLRGLRPKQIPTWILSEGGP